jgi:hypothetical protein
MEKRALLTILAASGLAANGQGTFRNLDFESTRVQDLAPGASEFIPITEALSGRIQYSSGQEFPDVGHNFRSSGGAFASILGPHYSQDPIIEGNYTVFMTPGPSVGNDLSLAQMGTVPVDARSILFKASGFRPSFIVSLGGLPLDVIALESTKSYTLYGAEISRFAGSAEELRLQHSAPSRSTTPDFTWIPSSSPPSSSPNRKQ